MGVGDHGLEPDAEIVDPFERRLEIDLIVLAAWGDGEGQGHLGAGAADRVNPVSKYKAPLAPLHPRVGVAPPGLVVIAPLTVGFEVGAVDCDDFAFYRTTLQQPPEQVFEDLQVGVLPEAVLEVGEEAVARRPLPETAGPCGLPVAFQRGRVVGRWGCIGVASVVGLSASTAGCKVSFPGLSGGRGLSACGVGVWS